AEHIPPVCEGRFAAGDLAKEIEGHIVLYQYIAAIRGQLRVLYLQDLEAECAALFGDGLAHPRRLEFMDLGGPYGGPSRLPVAWLPHEPHTRAELQEWRAVGLVLAIGEGQQFDIELAGDFAQQVVHAHRAAVGKRVRYVGREDGHAPAPGYAGPAFHAPVAG